MFVHCWCIMVEDLMSAWHEVCFLFCVLRLCIEMLVVLFIQSCLEHRVIN